MDWLYQLLSLGFVLALASINLTVMWKGLTLKDDRKVGAGKLIWWISIVVCFMGFVLWGLGAAEIGGQVSAKGLLSAGTGMLMVGIVAVARAEAMIKNDSDEAGQRVKKLLNLIAILAIVCWVAFIIIKSVG